jgi:hypothetical protein
MDETGKWKSNNYISFKYGLYCSIAFLIFNLIYVSLYYHFRKFGFLAFFILAFTTLLIFIIYILYFFLKIQFNFPDKYYKKIGETEDLDYFNKKIIKLLKNQKYMNNESQLKRGITTFELKKYHLNDDNINIGIQNISMMIYIFIEPITNENKDLFYKWSKRIDELLDEY